MGLAEESGSIGSPSIINILLAVFTTRYIFLMLGITLIILTLYSYIFFKSSKWILKWYRAEKIQRNERNLLYSTLEDLSRKADVKTPEIFSFKSEIPEIFTVGSGSKATIAISTSMLGMFGEIELEGLLAHEIGHIKNKDVSLNTITAFLAGLIMSFPHCAMLLSILFGFGQYEEPAPRLFKFIATALAAPPAAILVHLTNPAKREFAADEVAIELTKNPQSLANKLEFLENYIPLQPVSNKFNLGHFHLFSTHTQQIRGHLSIFISMFNTHPEVEGRVKRILNCSEFSGNKISNNKHSKVPEFFDLKSWRLAMGASFISYMIILLGIIVGVTLVMKDFDFLTNGIIAGGYIGIILLIMSITARFSRRKY